MQQIAKKIWKTSGFETLGEYQPFIEEKSAESFCCQLAAWFPDTFCIFYLVKNQKITKN
jgi:hypothetical protein